MSNLYQKFPNFKKIETAQCTDHVLKLSAILASISHKATFVVRITRDEDLMPLDKHAIFAQIGVVVWLRGSLLSS